GRDLAGWLRPGGRRVAVAAWVVVAVLLLVGSRQLVGGRIPTVAGLVPFDDGPLVLLREYLSGWRPAGLGSESPAPTALALLGLGGVVFLGAMGVLQQVLVLGALPVGVIGSWRLGAGLGSAPARAVAVLVYAGVALPYDGLARGRWDGLVLYAAAPWLLRRVLAATGEAPFAPGTGASRWGWRREVLTLGILVAVVAAFVPAVVLLVPVVALALGAGSLVTGGARGAGRALTVASGASVVAAVLHLPWSAGLALSPRGWSALGGVAPLGGDRLGLAALLRLETGPHGASVLGWSVLVAAALPLVIGRRWRFGWAARLWFVAFGCWALAWAGARDALPVALPPAEVVLAPGAAALALAAAVGMSAFERDLRGYHFGWRQIASVIAGAAVLVGLAPLAQGAVGGRWGTPTVDFSRTLAFMDDSEVTGAGAFRVLWVGEPGVLPVAGHRLDDGLAYGLSDGSTPGPSERWAEPEGGATGLVGDTLRLSGEGGTDRLGRLLAPLGVRYLAVVDAAAPARTATAERPLPAGVHQTFSRQLDLRRIEVDPALDLYENVAWAPVRAALPAEVERTVESRRPLEAAVGLDLSGAEPVLPAAGHLRFSGPVGAGVVYLAEAASPRWELSVGGTAAERMEAYGWANAFIVGEGGDATLTYRTSPLRWLAVLGQVLVWLVVVWVAVRLGARRTRGDGSAGG
ncbi:MAG: hypothetical protein ACRDZ9_02705, partial [Acidimicrobiales bacterium]